MAYYDCSILSEVLRDMEVVETDEENNNTVRFLLHAYLPTSFDCISISTASEFFCTENKVVVVCPV